MPNLYVSKMTIKRCLSLCMILCTILMIHISAGNNPAHADSTLDNEKQRLQQLQTKINNTRDTIREMESREHSVSLELETVERQYAKISDNLNALKAQANQLQNNLKTITRQRIQQEKKLQQQQNSLANQFRAAYRSGQQQQWRLFLNQTDPAKMARHIIYFQHLNQSRLTQINTVRNLLSKVQSLEENARSITNNLESKYQQIKNKQHTLENTRNKRLTLLTQIRGEINDKKTHLSQLLKHEKQLQQLISEISESIEDLDLAVINKQPFSKLKGKLPWPLKTWASFRRRITNSKPQGLIIKTAEGSEVRAVAHGRVVFSDWMPGYGLLIIIDHGANYLSLYANNQNLKTSVGDTVNAGETIALAGTSGGQSEPALYFEIRKRKRQENPIRWLAKANKK